MINYNKTLCPICHKELTTQNYKESYISPYNNQEYKLYECPNCDVHWWEPLKIIPEFYESEIFESYVAFHEGVRLRLGQYHEAFFEHFPQINRGRLLDVGCGDGVFLKHAKQAGFEVWGIDFDRKSVEVARKALNTDTIYAMSLEEFYEYAKKKKLKFDVITFFEVLEHQDKPREFLRMVRELLKEGGYIAGSVPNRERLFAKDVDWKYFHGDYPPHHFLRFSKECLEKVLDLTGFSEADVRRLDFSFKELFPYLEKKFLGNLDRLKLKLKASVVGSERRTRVYAVEDLDKVSERKVFAMVLKALKLGRNLTILPFAFLYLGKLKGNGRHLYFQAKKS